MSKPSAVFRVTCLIAFQIGGCNGASDHGAHAADTAGAAGQAGAGAAASGGAESVGVSGGASARAGGTAESGASNAGNAGAGGGEPSGGAPAAGVAGTGGSGALAGGAANGGAGGLSAGGAGGGAGSGASVGGAASTGGAAGAALPAKIVAGYYPNWTPSPARIKDVNSHYNLIYLFAATPVGGAPGTTGAITWSNPGDGRGAATNLVADLHYARATQGRKIVLSVGGAGNGMSFPTRAKSQAFVNSVVEWYGKLGGFDGLDWNTFEGNQAPDTNEMIWISLQLKQHYPGFIISAPPAPWNGVDQTFCAAMVQAGALDYAAPQYYDGPNLATQSYMLTNVAQWVKLLGASRVVVGFGIWNQPNYMSITDALAAWKALKMASPALRGAFDWQIHIDETQGWPFASQLGPLVE